MPGDAYSGATDAAFTVGLGDFIDVLGTGGLAIDAQLRRKDAMLVGLLRALGTIETQVGNAGGWKDVHHERFANLTIRSLVLVEEIFREIKPLLTDEAENASLSWTSDGLVEASPEGPPEPLRTVGVTIRAESCGDLPVEIVDEQGQAYVVGARFVDGRFERRFQVAAGRTLTVSCGGMVLGTYCVPAVP